MIKEGGPGLAPVKQAEDSLVRAGEEEQESQAPPSVMALKMEDSRGIEEQRRLTRS